MRTRALRQRLARIDAQKTQALIDSRANAELAAKLWRENCALRAALTLSRAEATITGVELPPPQVVATVDLIPCPLHSMELPL